MSGIFGRRNNQVRSTVSSRPVSSAGLLTGQAGQTLDTDNETPNSANGLFNGDSGNTVKNNNETPSSGDGLFNGESRVVVRTVAGEGGGGTGDVTTAQLNAERDARIAGDNAEITARTTADTGLSDRITTLENAEPATSDARTPRERLIDTLFTAERTELNFVDGLPSVFNYRVGTNDAAIIETYNFDSDGNPSRFVYTGPEVDRLYDAADHEAVQTFTFVDGLPSIIIWSDDVIVNLILELSLNGLLTRPTGTTADASLTENGLLTVPGGSYTLTENGLLQEMA